MSKRRSGTREWSDVSANIPGVAGCTYDGYGPPDAGGCRYCYARAREVDRFHRAESWCDPSRPAAVDWSKLRDPKWYARNFGGWKVMFPTKHELSIDLLGPSLVMIDHLLNDVDTLLVVTKPRPECVRAVCAAMADHPYRDRLQWRFTITSGEPTDLAYWEPNAPPYDERFRAVKEAVLHKFPISFSMEPCLCPPVEAEYLARILARDWLAPWADCSQYADTGFAPTIWIGRMNKAAQRCAGHDPENRLPALLDAWNDDAVRRLYRTVEADATLRQYIRWKDSIKRVLGLPEEPPH